MIVCVWLAACLVLWLTTPASNSALNESSTFLPPESAYTHAQEEMAKAFPDVAGQSSAVVIFERCKSNGPAVAATAPATAAASAPATQAATATAKSPNGSLKLTPQDRELIEQIAAGIRKPGGKATPQMLQGVTVTSPADMGALKNWSLNPMLSQDGCAAIIRVGIPSNFITMRSARIVEHIQDIVNRSSLPPGLSAAVTGSSGFGRDYALAAEESHRRTLYVTLAAVAIILMLVYRAPLAALVPLVSISIAAIVALQILVLSEGLGLHLGTAERIFVVVLLYGAGVDYSLLVMSRYREQMGHHVPHRHAAARSIGATYWAILIAAGTNILGLLMLCFARYGIFRTTGPSVAVALGVGLLASLTLVPAIVAIIGPHMFWPSHKLGPVGRNILWPKIAKVVTGRPVLVLAIMIAALAWPMYRGTQQTWVYDAFAKLQAQTYGKTGNAVVGLQIVERHWAAGEAYPVELLVKVDRKLTPQQWSKVAGAVTDTFLPNGQGKLGVTEIRSIESPLGRRKMQSLKMLGPLLSLTGLDQRTKDYASSYYLSADGTAMRMEAVLDMPGFALATMDAVQKMEQAAQQSADEAIKKARLNGARADVYTLGATAEMKATMDATQKDFRLIIVLVLAVIFVMVMLMLRDVILSLFMLLSTVVSYFATLGIAGWVFVTLLGQGGLDWKIEIFLFVVMVAIGQDYNIFLVARLMQESRRLPPKEAAASALIFTGPVISSCGLIMAATLGSLMAGSLALLVQLGFALSLGMLIDTFIVRPLLLPAFCALTGRTGRVRK